MVPTKQDDAARVSFAAAYDQDAVQAQLAKILANPHFRNSKRSQSLLRFVVEAALAGDQIALKERYIGAAVFGREPAYDTAQDPIVRNAAIDVRKRLAQYYMEPEHTGELRIDLPIGSYQPSISIEHLPDLPKPEIVAAEPSAVALETMPGQDRSRVWKGLAAATALCLLAAAGAFLWNTRRTPAHELEAFWEPSFRDGKTIQICIGQPTRVYRFAGPRTEELNRALGRPSSPERDAGKLSISPAEISWVAPEYLFLRDAMAGSNVASWVQSRGRAYQLMSVAQTDYSRLRHVPLVTIGAFNNSWAIRVTAELRFVFDHREINGVAYNSIIDRRNPASADWKVAQPPGSSISEDFAIVTRVFDPATEKTVISAAGIETFGTLAASDFVTQAEYLGAALQAAPRDWNAKNVQFVLATRIIDGTPGPPRVLAAHFW